VLGDQLLRSGTSVGAHFREAQRAKSNLDFISKIEGGMQELEETAYWLELLEGTRPIGAFDKRGGPIDGDFRNDCT
jgi:four helix bundle protein